MPGTLNHSPAEILRAVLIALWEIDPESLWLEYAISLGDVWPLFVNLEPDGPDNAITMFDTGTITGRGRTPDGEIAGLEGIRVRVRSTTHEKGWVKARAMSVALDKVVYQFPVTVDDTSYRVHEVKRTGVSPLGQAGPTSKRFLCTFDAFISVRLTL